jgi:integrase
MGIQLDNEITVYDWAVTWLKTYKNGVGYNTYSLYENILKCYIKPTFGFHRLKDLKTAHIQQVINENSVKYRTVEIFLLTMKQIMNQALINDLIIKNPALGAKLPPRTKVTGRRALTNEETIKLDLLDLDPKTCCYINLLRYTGMRKTKAGNRTIPILNPLRPILIDYINLVSGDYLFTTKTGDLFSKMAYRRMWQKLEDAMGTKEITAHIFRHNFATILYNAGVDVKTAQSIMGHGSISILMDIYTHLNQKNKEKAANQLNDYLK